MHPEAIKQTLNDIENSNSKFKGFLRNQARMVTYLKKEGYDIEDIDYDLRQRVKNSPKKHELFVLLTAPCFLVVGPLFALIDHNQKRSLSETGNGYRFPGTTQIERFKNSFADLFNTYFRPKTHDAEHSLVSDVRVYQSQLIRNETVREKMIEHSKKLDMEFDLSTVKDPVLNVQRRPGRKPRRGGVMDMVE